MMEFKRGDPITLTRVLRDDETGAPVPLGGAVIDSDAVRQIDGLRVSWDASILVRQYGAFELKKTSNWPPGIYAMDTKFVFSGGETLTTETEYFLIEDEISDGG